MYALYKSMSTGKQKLQEDCYTSAQIYQKHSSRQYLVKSRKWNISGITRIIGIAVWIQADSKKHISESFTITKWKIWQLKKFTAMIMKQFLIVQLRQAGRGSQTSCTTNLLAGEVFFKKISNLYSWKKSKPNVFKITSLAGILRTKSFLNHCCIIMWRKFIVIFFKKNFGKWFFWHNKRIIVIFWPCSKSLRTPELRKQILW